MSTDQSTGLRVLSRDEARGELLVSRKTIIAHFKVTAATVANWTNMPSFPQPCAVLDTQGRRPFLYRSVAVTRWVRMYRPKHLAGRAARGAPATGGSADTGREDSPHPAEASSSTRH